MENPKHVIKSEQVFNFRKCSIKTKFDLKKAEERAHILIGLSVSVENIDKIIKIIRSSKNPDEAKKLYLRLNGK